MTQRQKNVVMVGVLVTLILAVLDQNIVTTASWAIVRDLDPVHGLERLPWLITVYALAATAALPLYGKLCDVYGARPVYLAAVGLFLLGSALCGLAQDMNQLIAFRAVQGLGGGGLMSVTMVVAAHLMPGEKRASAGGAGGLIAGVGMVAGPLLGGLFTDNLSWRWIFFVNLPLGLAVLVSAAVALRLDDGGLRHRIDYLGATLIAAAAIVLLLVTEWGGRAYAWDSAPILGLIGLDVALFAAFVRRQLTAAEPILPMELFRNATLRVAFPLELLSAMGLTGSIIYAILYLQAAQGIEATGSGLYLIPMAVGMVVSGTISGVLIARGRGSKAFLLTGLALSATALFLLSLLRPGTSAWVVTADLFLMGTGLGLVLGIVVLLVQNSVPLAQLGTATTGIRFTQTLGMAVGTALFGIVLNRTLADRLNTDSGTALLQRLPSLPADERARVVDAFVQGIDLVFLIAAGVMLAALALATLLRTEASRLQDVAAGED